MSPELETLDQLQGGSMPLKLIRQIFPDDEQFCRAIPAMLSAGDVRLLDDDNLEIPQWKWRDLFDDPSTGERVQLTLELTDQGARRIA